MRLRVVTPTRVVVDADVAEIAAPGVVGEFGVLPDHVRFLGALDPGALTYVSGGVPRRLIVHGGYVEVDENTITVLADDAELPEEIDVELARRELRKAEEALANERHDPVAIARLLREQQQARLRVEATAGRPT